MSKHYDILTIKKYISDTDKANHDVSELENNQIFMQEVLLQTHDRKMFYCASKEVRRNHDFIMFTISLFKEDISFILQVVNSYFNYLNDKPENSMFLNDDEIVKKTEIALLLRDIIPDTSEYKKVKLEYSEEFTNFYIEFLATTYEIMWSLEESEFDMLGLGFMLSDTYSDIIRNYIAEEFLKEIFLYNKDFNLEQLLHYIFKNKETVKSYNITEFLIDYVSSYDDNLGDYLRDNLSLLNHYQEEVSRCLNNWDDYEVKVYFQKFESFYQEIVKYQSSNGVLSSINPYDILKYITKIYGMDSLLNKYYNSLKEDEKTINLNDKVISIEVQRAISYIKSIFELYFESEIKHKKSGVLDWSLIVTNNKNRFFDMTLNEDEKNYK